MVSHQTTHDSDTPHSTDWTPRSDSVRITAQVRRQVLREFLADELATQQVKVDSEARDLRVLRENHLPCAAAENRASNATAVLQYIGAALQAYTGNRDFRGVAR